MENKYGCYLLVHATVLQVRHSDPTPGQSAPILAGAGLEQLLVRVWIPPPHITEHAG